MDTSFGCTIHQNILTLAEIDVKNTVYRRNLKQQYHDTNYSSNKASIEGYK